MKPGHTDQPDPGRPLSSRRPAWWTCVSPVLMAGIILAGRTAARNMVTSATTPSTSAMLPAAARASRAAAATSVLISRTGCRAARAIRTAMTGGWWISRLIPTFCGTAVWEKSPCVLRRTCSPPRRALTCLSRRIRGIPVCRTRASPWQVRGARAARCTLIRTCCPRARIRARQGAGSRAFAESGQNARSAVAGVLNWVPAKEGPTSSSLDREHQAMRRTTTSGCMATF